MIEAKRESIRQGNEEKYRENVDRLEIMEEECFACAFGRIQQAVGADPNGLEMTLVFHRKD